MVWSFPRTRPILSTATTSIWRHRVWSLPRLICRRRGPPSSRRTSTDEALSRDRLVCADGWRDAPARRGVWSSSTPKGRTCNGDQDCAAGQFCNSSQFCQISPGCTSDSSCPAGQTCNTATGICQCSADAGCPIGQVCSAALQCEMPSACNFNLDCPTSFFCDTLSHRCIADGTCAQNIHCPAGMICQNSSCVVGCITDGDCALADFDSVPPRLIPYACLNGQCVQNGCNTSADCPAFYSCGANAQCQSVCQSTPFCSACDPEDALFGENPCGSQANLCLDDPRNATDCGDGSGDAGCFFFCGLDCSAGQACPQGSECTDVTEVNPDGIGGPGEACNAGGTCSGPERRQDPMPGRGRGKPGDLSLLQRQRLSARRFRRPHQL